VLRLIAAELRHRRGRALALLAGIAVATAAFTVLTGASESSRLDIRGNVAEHFRGTYDLLVRPPKTVSALERRAGLVQRSFLAGTFGGITLDQLRTVRRAPGVEVAAPLAVYGYVMPTAEIPLPVADDLKAHPPRPRALYRISTRWTADRGTVRVKDPDSSIYVTENAFAAPPPRQGGAPARVHATEYFNSLVSGPVCPSAAHAPSAFAPQSRTFLWCWSTRSGLGQLEFEPKKLPASRIGGRLEFPFPLLVAGIDPAAEAQLEGADRAVVSGRYLRQAEKPRLASGGLVRTAPILMAASSGIDLRADVAVRRLPAGAAEAFMRARDNITLARRAIERTHSTGTVLRTTVTADDAYAALLRTQRAETQSIGARWIAGPSRYALVGPDRVRAVPTGTDRYAWGAQTSLDYAGTGFVTAPATGHDLGFRRFTEHVASYPSRGHGFVPLYDVVGTFDPNKLADALNANAAPLNPFHRPGAPAADPAAAPWLRGGTLAPDGNMAGYLIPPPALLTTIESGSVFSDAGVYGHETAAQAEAPISVIRVRVGGVTGPDQVSRERLRVTAETIAKRTGLQVDVVSGASPTAVTVDLPASRLGRPAVALRESWMKKGVATVILDAVDRKSLILFLLVLVVCALFCVNATAAAVRTRATELGVLACVGWPRRALFRLLLAEVALIGAAAGVAGTLVALPAGAVLGLPVSGARAALAIPGATLLALLAATVPAARAARSDPLAAVRPAVRPPRSARSVRSVRGLAVRNLLRVPGRTALGVVSLAVGVAALTGLLAVTTSFRGAVVGTVLGDAVAVQVRTADYVAAAATLLLGGLACADVLYLNLRDRSAEIATLRATGWRERQLTRLVALEGAGLGLLGGLLGAAAGLGAAAAFAGRITLDMGLVAAGAALLAVAIAVLASLPPAAQLRRLPTATLLAEE
jgi:putative ABC transport system permease protein